MNKDDYVKAMNELKISEDFKDRTAMKMKEARMGSTGKNTAVYRRLAVTAAGLVILVTAGAMVLQLPGNELPEKGNNTFKVEGSLDTGVKEAKGITIPTVEIPEANNSGAAVRMRPLFVYKGHIYIQSSTAFEASESGALKNDEVLALRGDYLGKTKGSIDEWSSQKDYEKEFASTIGEGKVYTIKGYDSSHRLMVYNEYQDGGVSCELYDSFGGMTIMSGEDYFKLLNLKGNVASYQWESYTSWNNGMKEVQDGKAGDALEAFLDSLYTAVPIGDNTDMMTENTEFDSQKFVDIKTKDKLITTLRLFKGGYVYDSQAGFFKVDDQAFQNFWDTMPVTEPSAGAGSNEDTGVSASLDFTLTKASLPVGTKELKALIKNNGSEDIFYGADYSIEKLKGGDWKVVPGIADMAFIEIAYSAAPGTEQEFTVDLSRLKPSLKAGSYRLVKNINGQTFYAEFEMKK
ncbi:hypothetical protein SAMN02745136_02125 [Anaerocolumna jejuensis DSM 15929]|uniref:Bacterial Ig-like domain-containing protein n=1 Tax=Anaerocolumna jejuensis DSM 15929 TaxID=1121322 RepID=A0A1M6R214_9FIRM|nr:immunoglobulin-like domain-containing protein [Anaerocolumna jejuensis]SHK26541.1 hypothetical protein SAMN02745136_02125 [Anaerocolumna jejuensis DSM 15929]